MNPGTDTDGAMQKGRPHAGRKTCGAKTRICRTCGCHRAKHTAGGKDGGCTACAKGCGKFVAKACADDKLGAGGRCRRHGGASLQGIAHPQFKTGERWRGALPAILGVRFGDALADPHLARLLEAMALNDAMLTSYTASLKDTGRPLTLAQEKRVNGLLEVKRKLAESEARRRKDLAELVAKDQVRTFVALILELFREYVRDVKDRQAIHRRIGELLPDLDAQFRRTNGEDE